MSKKVSLLARRWSIFRIHRRGYISLIIIGMLFFLSLFAEELANDKPILIRFQGEWFFPVLFSYPETTFGGDFLTETDYRDPFVQALIQQGGWMVWPPIRYHTNTIHYNLPSPPPTPPDRTHLLGTDDQGRDVLARVIYGFRISIIFGILLTFMSSLVGIAVGALQGYLGGMTDLIGQRFIEIWTGLPALFILISVSGMIVPSFWWLLFLLLTFSWTGLVGVVRAEFLKGRQQDYVKAAQALGVSPLFILIRHVLPNAMTAIMTYLPFVLAGSIVMLASLDFLGLGLPESSPSLGELLSQGKNNIHAPWLGITAFLVLAVTLSLLIFIGEAVRDAFDPRKHG
ncbi:MAG: ABC transporter permease [Gammaproteobacteria bacterium]|nr:ABC transporter permease [Gammaproteobacteria bacterium]